MAYDPYRDSSSSYEPSHPQNEISDERYPPSASYATPYPSQYAYDQIPMPQPRMPSPQSSAPSVGSQGRINDAVASAVNKAENTNYLTPDLISQVTATVIQQLKAYGLDSSQTGQQTGQQPLHTQPAPPTQAPVYNESTVYSANTEPREVNPPSVQQSRTARPARASPRPEFRERRESPASRTSEQETRSNAPRQDSSDDERTTLEKIWGKLFEDGKPTARLGQFLRGIAVHMIQDYHPGDTIVVVPDKMQKLYADTQVPTDNYPWQDIFDDHTSSISRLYRDIEAEHHLVQAKLHERPDIPGLTPRGFERWMTLMIQANPDREFTRLQKAVLDMPISNPDDKKERFPKELPRRLFPSSPDLAILKKLEVSIIEHCGVDLPPPPAATGERPKSPRPAPPRSVPVEKSPSRAATAPGPQASERGHQSHSAASSAVLADDEDETIPSRPIERERKPYSVQPGGGRLYEETLESQNSMPESISTSGKAKEFVASPTSTSGHRQSHSYGQELPNFRNAPPATTSSHQHTSSRHGRTRSSSVGINGPPDYRHSESDIIGHDRNHGYGDSSAAAAYKSASTTSAIPGDVVEDGRRYRDYDRDDRDYEVLRERERDRERRYRDPAWNEEEYYRGGMLGGQGGAPVSGGATHDHRSSYSNYR